MGICNLYYATKLAEEFEMAHKRRNGKFLTKARRANHGRLGSLGAEKSQFCRHLRRKRKGALKVL